LTGADLTSILDIVPALKFLDVALTGADLTSILDIVPALKVLDVALTGADLTSILDILLVLKLLERLELPELVESARRGRPHNHCWEGVA
jgi:energy-converting hydrogenase Eha subunit C